MGEVHREVICLVPGPIHLFWTTGIYFVIELEDDYDIVLVAGPEYRTNSQFARVTHLFHAIYYLNENGKNPLKRHKHLLETAESVLEKHRPRFVLQHNHVYPFNIYLFNLSRRIAAYNISIQVGFQHSDPESEYAILKSLQINLLYQRSRLRLPLYAAKAKVTLRNAISYYSNYYLLPILTIGKPLLTPFDPLTHSVKRGRRRHFHYDLRLVYSTRDAIKTKSENAENILEVRNPVIDNHPRVRELLYDNRGPERRIIILPDAATSDHMFLNGSWNEKEIVEKLYCNWGQVVATLHSKFNDYSIGIKLHPSQKNDRIWNNVVLRIAQEYQDLIIHKPEEDAMRLIFESRIVVGEASTALWFAKNLGRERILVSLDIFNQPLADAYALEEGILYFKSVDELMDFDFRHYKTAPQATDVRPSVRSLLALLTKRGVLGVLAE